MKMKHSTPYFSRASLSSWNQESPISPWSSQVQLTCVPLVAAPRRSGQRAIQQQFHIEWLAHVRPPAQVGQDGLTQAHAGSSRQQNDRGGA